MFRNARAFWFLLAVIAFAFLAAAASAQSSGDTPGPRNELSVSFQALGDFLADYTDGYYSALYIGRAMNEICALYEYRIDRDWGVCAYFDWKNYTWPSDAWGPAIHAGAGIVTHYSDYGADFDFKTTVGIEFAGVWESDLDVMPGLGFSESAIFAWRIADGMELGLRCKNSTVYSFGGPLRSEPGTTINPAWFFDFSIGPIFSVAF